MIEQIKNYFTDHEYQAVFAAATVAFVVFSVLEILKTVVAGRLIKLTRHFHPELEELLSGLLNKTKHFVFFVVSIYAGLLFLPLTEPQAEIAQKAVALAFLIQFGLWGNVAIEFFISRYLRKTEATVGHSMTVRVLATIARGIFWVLLFLLALDNLGFNITSLLAGLGVGGVAVALAVQNILGDLFSSLTIVLDKPFVIGDFVIIDEYMGNIEKIGMKTTRIRSLTGEQLIFGNADLLKSRIRNYKQMQERRGIFQFGVIYQTKHAQLEAIPGMVKKIIEDVEGVRFDRCHFKTYGSSSLDFEAVFWVSRPEYMVFMDKQQEINLALFKKFEEEGIDFAYPTRTLFIENAAGGGSPSQPSPVPV